MADPGTSSADRTDASSANRRNEVGDPIEADPPSAVGRRSEAHRRTRNRRTGKSRANEAGDPVEVDRRAGAAGRTVTDGCTRDDRRPRAGRRTGLRRLVTAGLSLSAMTGRHQRITIVMI